MSKSSKNEAVVVEANVEKSYNVEALLTELKTKSAVIRFLHNEKLSRSEIAKLLNIRYQHVRNVLTQELKKK